MYTQENDTKRFAFYQAGKCLVQTLLLHHPKASIFKITEPSNDMVSFGLGFSLMEILSVWNNKAKLNSSLLTTTDLETLLIGFYAGKTGELLTCHTSKKKGSPLAKTKRFLSALPLKQKTNQSSVKSLFDYNKSTFIKSPRKHRIQLIEKRSYKERQRKVFAVQKGMQNRSLQSRFVRTKALPLSAPILQKQEHFVSAPLKCSVLINRLNSANVNHLLYQSDIGSLERINATFIAEHFLRNQSISFPRFLSLQRSCKVGNLNKTEISDSKVLDIFNNLRKQITSVFLKEIKAHNSVLQKTTLTDLNVYSILFYKKGNFVTKKISLLSQKKEISAWCEEKVCKALMFSNKSYGHWFRIYLPQIETHQQQPVSQDHFFKTRFELDFFRHSLANIDYTQMPALLIRGADKRHQADTNKNIVKKKELDKKPRFVNKTGLTKALPLYAQAGLTKPCKNEAGLTKAVPLYAKAPLLQAACKNCVFARLFARFGNAISPHYCAPVQFLQKVKGNSVIKHNFERERDFDAHFLPQEFGYEMCHTIIVNAFSKVLNITSKNRELLDMLTDHLIRFEKIRVPEILYISLFYTDDNSLI